MKVCCRLWFDNDGKAFGQGPYRILLEVQKLGSLNQAAKELDLSYNKAWKTIQMVEKRIGFKLLESASGGKTGGGSTLTPEAIEFLSRYERFKLEVDANIQATFDKYFPE
ncbi:MAG: LysR family transcriptional regulator [Clostridia bacterium]|jgi:molybdate transport system regulatory protein|nr:LysR family transcriptional regulator [Clostridia bacterium]